MDQININGSLNLNEIKPHFIYKNYAANCREILNLKKMKFLQGAIDKFGYRQITIRHEGCDINYSSHRFIFECHFWLILKGFIIDHINNNKLTNNIKNLQIITQSENTKKNYKLKSREARAVRGICLDTGLIYDFKSRSFAGKVLEVHPMSIKFVCDNKTNTTVSKLMGHHYYFYYLFLQ